eukprot:NODE_1317_length_1784_cov_47.137869_g1250_i0.p1 GENE.NODE_1317_length_1784_cov_47.137869_g1250_i0~~NODE_1317_length_1784_cov_47.137869_g1250_i0.p1  ORF type:complete len:294 (-),score=46.87 NODE_1317_length_1784_cov_47.137869_g1250_i0:847-1728(-)
MASKLRIALFGAAGLGCGGTVAAAFSLRNCESPLYNWVVDTDWWKKEDPVVQQRRLLGLARWGLGARDKNAQTHPEVLALSVCNMFLTNPIGVAAGIDSDASAFESLLQMGYSHVEVGSITLRPQDGNTAPSAFRLAEDDGIIGRAGLPSLGLEAVKPQLKSINRLKAGVVGVNLAANADSVDPAQDFAKGIHGVAEHADYIVLNLCAPDVPGYDDKFHRMDVLRSILREATAARNTVPHTWKPPLFIKVSPDLSSDRCRDIVGLVTDTGVDGIIVGGASAQRPKGLNTGLCY